MYKQEEGKGFSAATEKPNTNSNPNSFKKNNKLSIVKEGKECQENLIFFSSEEEAKKFLKIKQIFADSEKFGVGVLGEEDLGEKEILRRTKAIWIWPSWPLSSYLKKCLLSLFNLEKKKIYIIDTAQQHCNSCVDALEKYAYTSITDLMSYFCIYQIYTKKDVKNILRLLQIEDEFLKLIKEYREIQNYLYSSLCKDKKLQQQLKEQIEETEKKIINKLVLILQQKYIVIKNENILVVNKDTHKFVSKDTIEIDIALFLKDTGIKFNYKSFLLHHLTKKYKDIIIASPSTKKIDKYNIFEYATEPKRGECNNFKKFIQEVICNNEKKTYEYLLDWIAFLLQFPDKKEQQTVAIVLQGKKGVGKSFFLECISSLIEKFVFKTSFADALFERFNAQLQNKILVILEEAFSAASKRQEARLKDLITSPTIDVEAKHKPRITIQNYMRFIFITNEDWVVRATRDERRYLVLRVSSRRQKDTNYFARLHKAWWEEGERQAFLHEMLCREIKSNLRIPPVTEQMREQILHSLPAHQAWFLNIVKEEKISVTKGNETITYSINQKIPSNVFYTSYLQYAKSIGSTNIIHINVLRSLIEKFIKAKIEVVRENQGRFYLLPPLVTLQKNLADLLYEEAPF